MGSDRSRLDERDTSATFSSLNGRYGWRGNLSSSSEKACGVTMNSLGDGAQAPRFKRQDSNLTKIKRSVTSRCILPFRLLF
jgi:hypothetical protein